MPNTIKGEVDFEIGGDKHPLIFSYEAIATIESEFEKPLIELQHKIVAMNDVKLIMRCLHVTLSEGGFDKDLPKQLPPIEYTCDKLMQALHVAYFGDVPPAVSEENGEDGKKQNPQES